MARSASARSKRPRQPAASKSLRARAKKAVRKAASRSRRRAIQAPAGRPPDQPPQAVLMQALFGVMVTRSVSAVAELGVPDALRDGPLYYTDLATAVGADQRALHRVMRMLSGVGIFTEAKPGTYALTPVSELLRADAPGSMRDLAVMITARSHWLPWGRLADVLRTGESGPRLAFGTDVFTWFQAPENLGEWQIFNDAMTSFSMGTAHAVAEAVNFGRFRSIVDVGGGHGYLLDTVLATAPRATGTVFDLPGVAETAPPVDRVTFVGGDFFQGVPAGGDCYLLKHIVHDWSDQQSVVLLSNIARALAPRGRVFVIETVMPDAPEAHPAKFMDVNMLAMTEGGCERTVREYAALFREAGLALVRVHPTRSPVSVVEAKKGS